MKKYLFSLPLLLLPILTSAEELKFVTVLSSPVGTFNRLETVDPTVPVKSPAINFCTKLGNSGTVTLQGNKNPEAGALSLSNGTILGGNGKDYVLNTLTMKQGGTLKGSRLLANTVKVPNGGMGKSENLYSNNLLVAGAKTGKLYVNGTDAVIEEAWPADVTMVWSNEYQSDKACDNPAGCAKQYLLKQKGNTTTNPAGDITCTEDSRGGCGSAFDQNGNPSHYWAGTPLCSEVDGFNSNFEGECVYIKDCEQTIGISSLRSESYPSGECRGTGEYHGSVSCCSSKVAQSERNTCGEQSWMNNPSDWAYYTKPENATALCSKMGQVHKPEGYWQWNGTYSMNSSCYLYYSGGTCLRLDVSCNQKVTKQEAIRRTCTRN